MRAWRPRRRQWIQDTQAHVRQVLSALENIDQGFPAISIPGNADLHSDVGAAQEQQQLALEQQDVALDRIEKAAQRVGALGLEIHREIGVRRPYKVKVNATPRELIIRAVAGTSRASAIALAQRMSAWCRACPRPSSHSHCTIRKGHAQRPRRAAALLGCGTAIATRAL